MRPWRSLASWREIPFFQSFLRSRLCARVPVMSSRFFGQLGTVLGSIAGGLLIAEAAVRFLAPQSVGVPWQDEVGGLQAPRANVRGRHAIPGVFDVTLTINSQRFRGQRVYETQPGRGVLRIAALGDSFTLGAGANDDEAYPAQLERILQERLHRDGAHRVAEVINAGATGTGTGEQALWYTAWVRAFHPQIVVLTVVSNDLMDDLVRNLFVVDTAGRASPRTMADIDAAAHSVRRARRLVNALPGYGFLAQHSHLLNLLRMSASRRLGWQAATGPAEHPAEDWQKQGLFSMCSEVVWLNDRVHESGARLAVVFVPFPQGIRSPDSYWAETSHSIVEALTEACSKHAILFSDTSPVIRRLMEQGQPPLYYGGRDFHPTAHGYRVIAEAVADLLIKGGAVQ